MDLSCGAKHSVNLFFSAWSAWLEWTECTASCGGGIQSRSRTCINGLQGEEGCQGPDVELRVCNVDLCQTSAGIVIVYLLPTKTFFFLISIFVQFVAFLAQLKSRPKSSRPRRDIDVSRLRRDRDFEQKLETRPRLERSETETRHETFETKRLQYFANSFDSKFWTFGELPNTLQYRFLGLSLLY